MMLLNQISSDSLIIICAVMSLVALFLAIAASLEVFNNYRRKKVIIVENNKEDSLEKKNNSEEIKLNIKEDANIKYEEEDEELEKTKAKLELEKLKERLLKEEEEKKKLLEINLALVNSKENEKSKETIVATSQNVEQNNLNGNKKDEKLNKSEEENKKITEVKVAEVKSSQTLVTDKRKSSKNFSVDDYLNANNKYRAQKEKAAKAFEHIEKKTKDDKTAAVEEQENINAQEQNVEKLNSSLSFDDYQDENAIISYDELKNATNFGYTDEEMEKYEDEKDAIISIQELERLYKESNELNKVEIKEFDIKKVEDLPAIADNNGFQKSPSISPVFGIDITEEDISLEKTANLEKLNIEIKKTNEFLKALKDLKKNLQ